MADNDAAAMAADPLLNADRIRRSTELPAFYGDPEKDSISALTFINRMENAAEIGHWDNARKYSELLQMLRGPAAAWAQSLKEYKITKGDWEAIKKSFLVNFEKKITVKTACANFTDLVQKKNENTRDFFSRVCKVFRTLDQNEPENFNEISGALGPIPAADALRFKKEGLEEHANFMKECLFLAGLHADLREAVIQTGKLRIPELQLAAREQEALLEEKKKGTSVISSIQERECSNAELEALKDWPQEIIDQLSDDDFYKINAVRGQFRRPPIFRRNFGGQARGPGAIKKMKCFFCDKFGHMQKDCHSRLKSGAPMVSKGKKITEVQQANPQAGTSGSVGSIKNLNW
jgi:hypothetical protein